MFDLNVKPVAEPFNVSACNSDVILDKVEYGESDDGKGYLDFYYSKGSQSLRDRRFPPSTDIPDNWVREGETKAETIKRMQEENSRVLQHIASKFCSDEDMKSVTGTTFKQFAQAYADAVNAKCKGVTLYMKTVLNAKKYVSVPKAGRFLQNMSEGPCTLSYTEKEIGLIRNHSDKEGVMIEENEDVNV